MKGLCIPASGESAIEEELAEWFRDIKSEISIDYRKFLYDEINASGIMRETKISIQSYQKGRQEWLAIDCRFCSSRESCT